MPSTAAAQYLLELINDARLDPVGDAGRYVASFAPLTSNDPQIQSALTYFGVDGPTFLNALAALTPAQPIAFNDALAGAALAHDGAMIAADSQSHQLPGEADIGGRAAAAGYDGSFLGENIFAYSENPLYAHAGFMVDWGPGPGGMQSPPGHRTNIMDPDFREVGIGIVDESDPATAVGPEVVTEDFGASRSSSAIVLGVDYSDLNADGFYTIGEGVAGLSVTAGDAGAASSESGGYALATARGAGPITLAGGDLAGDVSVTTDLSGANIKLDVVDGHILRTSASAAVSGAVDTIVGLGTVGLALTAGPGAQRVVGTSGADTLAGGGGGDVIDGGLGSDLLTGGGGRDWFVFRPGGGEDVVTDFKASTSAHDVLDFSSFADITSAAQVLGNTTTANGQAVIALDQSTIVLEGVTRRDLAQHRGDFSFHG